MTFIQTGGQAEFFAALKSGAVQSAVLNTGPFTIRAQKENFLRLADVAAMGRPYVYGTVAARESFIKNRPDVIGRFAKAFAEGIHRFKTDKSLALGEIHQEQNHRRVRAGLRDLRAALHQARAAAEGMQTILDEIGDSRTLPAGTAPQRFIDSRAFKDLNGSGFVDALYRGH